MSARNKPVQSSPPESICAAEPHSSKNPVTDRSQTMTLLSDSDEEDEDFMYITPSIEEIMYRVAQRKRASQKQNRSLKKTKPRPAMHSSATSAHATVRRRVERKLMPAESHAETCDHTSDNDFQKPFQVRPIAKPYRGRKKFV